MTKDSDSSNKVTVKPPQGGLKRLTGSSNDKVSDALLNQLINSLYLPESAGKEYRDKTVTAAIATMLEIAPKDPLEGILASQMVATHNAAMECLRRAAIENQTFEGRNSAFSHAQKLLRLYLEQMKALNKHRGKSDQKVVIEHVNVAPGAQAIVGNVEVTSGSPKKNNTQQISAQEEQALTINTSMDTQKIKVPTKNAQRKKQT